MAIAKEARVDLTLDDFDRLSGETLQLSELIPSGIYGMEDLDRAGGIPSVMKALKLLLNLDALTITGRLLKENITSAKILDEKVIRPLNKPIRRAGE